MDVSQCVIKSVAEAEQSLTSLSEINPNLVLVFSAVQFLEETGFVSLLQRKFPGAVLIGCSTAGEICQNGVEDGICVVTAVCMARVKLRPFATRLADMGDSLAAGERIGAALHAPDLRAVMVFGPGLQINGSDLVDGIANRIGRAVPIIGGLAGDGGAFKRTMTLGPDGVRDDTIVAVGFFGEGLQLGHGSFGGWQTFGPARKVTRCEGNVLYEVDGEPALAVYKRYLGDYADDLPASGLLFPLAMLGDDLDALGLTRTILGVNEADGSLTLAGAIDPNGYLKLMHASTDRLVGGAEAAAEAAVAMQKASGKSLAVLVSCVGRKLVMGDRVDEEVEAVGQVFGKQATLTGFYSYGEISPFTPGSACRLHNQTMTVTWIGET